MVDFLDLVELTLYSLKFPRVVSGLNLLVSRLTPLWVNLVGESWFLDCAFFLVGDPLFCPAIWFESASPCLVYTCLYWSANGKFSILSLLLSKNGMALLLSTLNCVSLGVRAPSSLIDEIDLLNLFDTKEEELLALAGLLLNRLWPAFYFEPDWV